MDVASIVKFTEDVEWAKCVPEVKSASDKRHLPTLTDCTPIDADAAAAVLAQGGSVGRAIESYEPRSGQIDMLKSVVHSFNGGKHLMIEAGTGVGKSLAYLVPAVLWSYVNDTPVIIATATRNLQSQLMNSDLPRAIKALENHLDGDRPFRAALLKGRSNYICLRAFDEVLKEGYFALNGVERNEFSALITWLQNTENGDLDEAPADELRSRIASNGEDCAMRRCPFWSRCFVRNARERAAEAHVIVANHALVLSEAANANASIFPAYGRLVFDEAHNLEDAATDFFSVELSRASLQRLLSKLERKKHKHSNAGGFITSLERHLTRGALAGSEQLAALMELVGKIRIGISKVQNVSEDLFDELAKLFVPAPRCELLRIRTRMSDPDAAPIRQYATTSLFTSYRDGQWDEIALNKAALALEDELARLINAMLSVSDHLQDATPEGELPLFGDLIAQAQAIVDLCRSYILDLHFVISASDEEYVYWVEKEYAQTRHQRTPHPLGVKMTAAPLSVAQKMHDLFYKPKDSVVMCSATLRTNSNFAYMAQRLGMNLAADRVKMLVAPSPFNYPQQCTVFAPDFLPDPATNPREYVHELAPLLAEVFEITHGRALVLWTAYEMMRAAANDLQPMLDARGIELIVQGNGMSREKMAERLRNATPQLPVVLFGSQSFWEGVDVSGVALSCVVITRLPFPQVGEPIVAARSDKIDASGGHAFPDYMIPEALITFRQGFGRLIRSTTDTGVVIIADKRITSKNYGAYFSKALPTPVHTITSPTVLLSSITSLFP